VRTPQETLDEVRRLAPSLGITRVVATTWLDRIGVPVYASIRPRGQTLCVHAGKGLCDVDARVGAYMEALEFEVAERNRQTLPRYEVSVGELESLYSKLGVSFELFCPQVDWAPAAEAAIACTNMFDYFTGEAVPVPAELIYLADPSHGDLFGTTTNGLASGNSFDEALLHALCELLERDTQAFNNLKDRSVPVRLDDAPDALGETLQRIESAGFHLFVRYTPSVTGAPHFAAYLMEGRDDFPLGIAYGTACHPIKSIALVRAVSEAVQARLTHIHGGRDDIIARHLRVLDDGAAKEAETYRRLRRYYSRRGDEIDYADISAPEAPGSVQELLQEVTVDLVQAGFPSVMSLPLEAEIGSLSVVRAVVPGLELFENHSCNRAGPRLRRYAEHHGRHQFLPRHH
jgi:ribosomal protein S12 methylthiotransferase accessory factor